ncbi:MAG: radical SAM protein [Peptococcaceae bacterium]
MATCKVCNCVRIAEVLGVCGPCIRKDPQAVTGAGFLAHQKSRFPLPPSPPRSAEGVSCRICANNCCLGPGEVGFCGLRANRDGRLVNLTGSSKKGLVTWYHDPLPTNCVADWVCPAGSEGGYPKYSYVPGKEYGYYNLAVFLGGCSFDCLFCQNRSYHQMATDLRPLANVEDLANAVLPKTACVCFFGGDPSPQIVFAMKACRLALEKHPGKILRICWETNGNINPRYLTPMAEISLNTGGCIKFDLKAWDEGLHKSLTGVSNRQTLANFTALAGYLKKRTEPPFLVASTLLVPGYVDSAEVRAIAEFISRLSPDIPYSLLAFYPHHLMEDLPLTLKQEALACREVALAAGLKQVRLGNVHLLA